jgi:hypothetical protein
MTREEALAKLISVRHHCFVAGVLHYEADYRDAFRTLNRLYVQLRDNRSFKGAKAPQSRAAGRRSERMAS